MIGAEGRYVNVKNDCSATGIHGTTGVIASDSGSFSKGSCALGAHGEYVFASEYRAYN